MCASDEAEKERVREVVAEHADALDGFETSDEHEPTNNLVYLEFEMLDREPDEEFVEVVAEEMTRLIQHYTPEARRGGGLRVIGFLIGFVLLLLIVAGVVIFGQALVSDFDEVVPEDEEG